MADRARHGQTSKIGPIWADFGGSAVPGSVSRKKDNDKMTFWL